MSVDAGILSLRPKIRRTAKQSEVVIKEAKEGSEEACLKIEVIGNPGQLLETIHSGKQMQALTTSDQEQSERCFKEVEKLESKEASSLSLTMEKKNKKTLYRDILESMNGGAFGELGRVEKKRVMRTGYTRLLTAEGGKLVENIKKNSGAFVQIIHSQGEEQTVMLSGSARVCRQS